MSATKVSLDDLIAMRLRARRFARPATRVAGHRSATHGSRFRGRGVDYVESRGYQPGDDIRQMDWRVTARTGRPHTKLFQEEREQSILLIVDANASMRFGTRVRFKSVQAARTAALLSWACVQSGDRIGALAFGSDFIGEVKPNAGPRGALRVLRSLVEWDTIASRGGATMPLSQALHRARRIARPGSRVILLSDGFSADDAAEGPLSLLAEHCDVAAIILSDPLEQAAPPPARYPVRGDGGNVLLDFGAQRLRTRWPQLFAERREMFLSMLRRRALRSSVLDTRAEPESALPRILGLERRAVATPVRSA
jgi:uncharacterized protein (DUF58 family)